MTIAAAPSFDLYKRFRVLAYILVILSVAGFSFAEGNPFALILITVGAALSWVIVEGPRGKPLPRALVNVGVLCTAGFLLYEVVFDGGPGRDGNPNLLLILGHFMTGILICKFFDRKTTRDYAQMFTLTLLVMVAGAIFSASLMFACILVVYLGLALYAVMLLHLRAETEAAIAGHIIAGDRSLLADGLLKRDIRRVAWWAMLLLGIVAVAVFLTVPRTRGQGVLNGWSGSGVYRTGFSDHVQLGEYGQLQQSDAVVMEVKIEQGGVNIGSEYLEPYFRGMALDVYDTIERRWVRSPADFPDLPTLRAGQPLELRPAGESTPTGPIVQHYTMAANVGNVLFTLAPGTEFVSDSELKVHYDQRMDQLTVDGQPPYLHYTVKSDLVAHDDGSEQPWIHPGDLGMSNSLQRSLDEPNLVPPEVSNLARELLKGSIKLPPPGQPIPIETIRAAADRFEEYLRTTYPYTLTLQSKDSKMDPTADFLLNCKDTGGHCEYFASAMVMLCRSVGINARMVSGYHGGEYNSISGTYVVRQKHAHEWAEVYFPGRGWVTFDATPASGDVPSELPFAHLFRDFSEIVQRGWLSSIIGFDNSSRYSVFEYIGSWLRMIPDYFRHMANDWGLTIQELVFSRSTSMSDRVLGTGSGIFILWMTFWLTYRWNRRRTSPINRILRKVDRRIQRQLAQDLLFFEELLRLLARTGFRRSADQTPREYVEGLTPRLRGAASDAKWLVSTFYDVRVGTVRVNAGLRTDIARALTNVRRELASHV